MSTIVAPLPLGLDLARIRAYAARQPHGFILDSGEAPDGWHFIGFSPRALLTSRGDRLTLVEDASERTWQGHPLEALQEQLDRWRLAGVEEAPPFWGGAVGYLSYDLGWQLERLPRLALDDLGLPEMRWGFYDVVVAVPVEGPALLCVSPAPGEGLEVIAAKRAHWERFLADLPAQPACESARALGEPRSTFSREAYREALASVLEHIAAGDIYQANLSQRFEIPVEGDAYAWFERLRAQNPAPFAAYFNAGEAAIVSVSPERFLEVRGDRVETAPIKGTRPRGRTPDEDARLADELRHSLKDRAEHLMIVDLERNDLGRVCRLGSVRVSDRFTLEAHPTVWHMVSTVEGRLAPGRDVAALLAATFPGGSITGAPKIRAMEILEGLEPTRRGVYTGAIGYLGRNGDLDLNIAIRTAVAYPDRVYVQVGGGIVADSDPDAEYQETLDKAAAFFRSLEVPIACVSF
ncbi:aminodeoxychorismate synthase component I [bacterium]|nr:aminodeoxychorismate synthase component I [bacterium]